LLIRLIRLVFTETFGFEAIWAAPSLNLFFFGHQLTLLAQDASAFSIRVCILAIQFFVISILQALTFLAYSRIRVTGVRDCLGVRVLLCILPQPISDLWHCRFDVIREQ